MQHFINIDLIENLWLLQFEGYLVVGYVFLHAEGVYMIDWTMPHCVLTLRLIGKRLVDASFCSKKISFVYFSKLLG